MGINKTKNGFKQGGEIRNYDGLKQTARNLIGSNGSNCHIERATGKYYNNVTHKYEEEQILITGVAVMTQYREQDFDGTVVLRDDVRFNFVADEGLSEEPQVGDVLVFSNDNYQIINVTPISPNGAVTLCYKLQARK